MNHLACVSVALSLLVAQTPPSDSRNAVHSCLPLEQFELIKSLKGLQRVTETKDPQLPFDPSYFVGQWTIDWDVAETPLGSGGKITGIETYRDAGACVYESQIDAQGPDGTFTVSTRNVYDPNAKSLVRTEVDSRGFSLVKTGHVGGDSGGYFSHFWESAVVAVKTSTVSLKGRTYLVSPNHYRVMPQISIDGGPFVDFGIGWWTKKATVQGGR